MIRSIAIVVFVAAGLLQSEGHAGRDAVTALDRKVEEYVDKGYEIVADKTIDKNRFVVLKRARAMALVSSLYYKKNAKGGHEQEFEFFDQNGNRFDKDNDHLSYVSHDFHVCDNEVGRCNVWVFRYDAPAALGESVLVKWRWKYFSFEDA